MVPIFQSHTTLSNTKINLYRRCQQGATFDSQAGNRSRTCHVITSITLVQEVPLGYHVHICIHDGLTPSIQCILSPCVLLLFSLFLKPNLLFHFLTSAPRNSNKDWVMSLKTYPECERDITQWGSSGVVSSSEEVEPVSAKKGRVKEANQLIQKLNPL